MSLIKRRRGDRMIACGSTRSQYIMTVAVLAISLYNFAVFMKTVRKYMQMQSMASNKILPIPPPPDHSKYQDSGITCSKDINQILSEDKCFDFHNDIHYLEPPPSSPSWHRVHSGRQKLRTSFWESDNVARCINDLYELVGLTYGAHILVGAQPILGSCPTIVVDAGWPDPSVPGSISKHIALVPSELSLATNPKKTSIFPFRNQMTLEEFRHAVDNARIMMHDDPSSKFFITNSCSIFPLDILAWLGIDFKGVHRKAATTLVLKGLLSSKETTDKVMSIIREKLRGKIGGTIWATLKSEKAIIHRVISIYIDNHSIVESEAGEHRTDHNSMKKVIKRLSIKVHKFPKFCSTVVRRFKKLKVPKKSSD